MKELRNYILVAFLVFSLLLSVYPPSVQAVDLSSVVEVKVPALNVRSGPSTNHSRVTQVRDGDILTLLARQGEWLQVKLVNGTQGYVFSGNGYAQIHKIQGSGQVTASMLNVRRGPGTSYTRIDQLPQGTKVAILETSNGWHRVVTPKGTLGWVSGNYVTTNTDSGHPGIALVNVPVLNVRKGPGTNYSIRTTVAANAALPVLEEKNDWYRVLLPGDVEGWVAGWHTQIKQPDVNSDRKAVVDTSVLNVRSGPSTAYHILTRAHQGQEFPVINSVPGWLNILLNEDTSAWFSANYVREGQSNSGGNSGTTSALKGRTIVIDPGHGGYDPGAVGLGGLTEKFVNLDTSLRLVKLLENAGARVVLSRSNDTFISLSQRVNMAHNVNADIFVSIHANAHNNRSIGGTETYYNGTFRPADSRRLAAAVQVELVKELKLRDIGVKTANFHVIRYTRSPSILVELAFLSNAREEALLRQPDFRQRSANAVYRGILNYFN